AVMHNGELQQVAPPMELYREPANQFVAGFIGTPAMNFLRRDGVVIGVRPHQLIVGADALRYAAPLIGRVWLIEPVGSEQIVHVALPDTPDLVAVVPSDRVIETGEELPIAFPPDAMHRFDRSTGRRLPP
ncbi:MAG TPA: TOBE domain-containing protein, partial [Gemmatimonadales bacterium]|nr:TOBE domain-containing protein [Gemmatimonadales bacterium]